jgi:hypothetical protein
MINHKEWDKENSLTSKEDRTSTKDNPWRIEQGVPNLTKDETDIAMKVLNNTDFIDRFPRVEKTYADPPILDQQFGLISFTPAKGATPNEGGVYGFAKLRGNYRTSIEARNQSEMLIKEYDSYHQIYHTFVGRPFPLTSDSKFSKSVEEIDIKKQTVDAMSAAVKAKKREEKNTIRDIKKREEALLEESKRAKDDDSDDDDPYETYITLKVKKAQLTWTYLEHEKKMEEIKGILVRTRKEIEELDVENPSYNDKYFEKYSEARKSSGLPNETEEDTQDNFMRFLVEDYTIPEVDEKYKKTYNC